MKETPSLYLSEDQSASDPVATFLDDHGIGYRDRTEASLAEISSETGIPESQVEDKLPVLRWEDGSQLENCDQERLVAFLRERGYEFEDS